MPGSMPSVPPSAPGASRGMSKAAIIITVIAVAALLGAYYFIKQGSAPEAQMSPTPTPMASPTPSPSRQSMVMTIQLAAQNKSGEQGTAMLEEVNGKVKVTINLSGEPKGVSQPAHIHVGACPNPGTVKYPLSNVVNGKSETMLTISVDEIMQGLPLPLAVNVHKSGSDLKTYVACGNIVNISPSGTPTGK